MKEPLYTYQAQLNLSNKSRQLFYGKHSIILATIVGSASVLVSPNFSNIASALCASAIVTSLEAILRKIRRIILPDRVLGSSGTITIVFGVAKGPILVLTCILSSDV